MPLTRQLAADLDALKKKLDEHAHILLKEVLGQAIHTRIHTSQVSHEALQPEGSKYRLLVEITVYPKIKENPE